MRATVTFRPARAGDADAVSLIYNQGIEDRVATLETEPRTPEERREWMATRGSRHPVIIAESGGSVIGWGSLNPFSAREAYRHAADFSVYVGRHTPHGEAALGHPPPAGGCRARYLSSQVRARVGDP